MNFLMVTSSVKMLSCECVVRILTPRKHRQRQEKGRERDESVAASLYIEKSRPKLSPSHISLHFAKPHRRRRL